jgi:hypothetical protein
MRLPALAIGLFMLGAAGCARPPAVEEEAKPELTPDLLSLVLAEAPSDLPNPSYLDFAGKVQLIGYALEPDRLAAPGSKLSLKLFWRSADRLAQGYQLYTELVTPAGKRFEVEGSGPTRKGALLPPSLEPGKLSTWILGLVRSEQRRPVSIADAVIGRPLADFAGQCHLLASSTYWPVALIHLRNKH